MIPVPLADPLARTLQFAQFDSVERRRYLSPPRLTNSTSRPVGLEITLQLPSSSFQSQSIFMGGPRVPGDLAFQALSFSCGITEVPIDLMARRLHNSRRCEKLTKRCRLDTVPALGKL